VLSELPASCLTHLFYAGQQLVTLPTLLFVWSHMTVTKSYWHIMPLW